MVNDMTYKQLYAAYQAKCQECETLRFINLELREGIKAKRANTLRNERIKRQRSSLNKGLSLCLD